MCKNSKEPSTVDNTGDRKFKNDSEQLEKDIIETDETYGITSPFRTKDISINNRVMSLSGIVSILEHNEILLDPEFQRNGCLWNESKMSRLIESILLKLPLPIFYFDVSNPDKWIVVDGLQRLSTIKKFIVDGDLKLKNLEFLNDLHGKGYHDLDRSLKRVIDETQINTYQIEAATPKEVRYSIFHRINTGGLSLNAQEIRQALNQDGKCVSFLKDIAESKVFKDVVNIKSQRMLDRELALRFIAFKILDKNKLFKNMGNFLDQAMSELDKKNTGDLDLLKNELIDILQYSEDILGKGHRFSRSIADDSKTNSLNRSLFDVITVCFSEIKEKGKFKENKATFKDSLLRILHDESSDFVKSITEGTSSKGAVDTRFKEMNKLIQEVLDESR